MRFASVERAGFIVDAIAHYLRQLPAADTEALLPRDFRALVRVFPVLKDIEPEGLIQAVHVIGPGHAGQLRNARRRRVVLEDNRRRQVQPAVRARAHPESVGSGHENSVRSGNGSVAVIVVS